MNSLLGGTGIYVVYLGIRSGVDDIAIAIKCVSDSDISIRRNNGSGEVFGMNDHVAEGEEVIDLVIVSYGTWFVRIIAYNSCV